MRSLTFAFAALFVLSAVRFDLTQTWADSDLVPAWPESERKPVWPDGPVKDFLRGLQRPDNDLHPERTHYARFCCDAGDTVKTKFKVEPGDGKHPDDRWYAWLNEKWVAIPSDKIVPGYAPDGQAYLFVTDFVSEMIDGYPAFKRIVCFVRPKGGL